ncbi:MAG: hypothetical protein HWE08_14705 [Alphaproteobacteria bacterium]|nr:hypothetical protein [Alphaproteobacteria bacterium]
MLRQNEIIFGHCSDLERPVLREAFKWVQSHWSASQMVDRNEINAPALAPYIRHASLFKLVIEHGVVKDYHASVLASHIADNIKEISGKSGKCTLPAELFERWRITAQHLIELRRPFRTRTKVFGKEHKEGESLVVPVSQHDELSHALVFTEYWLED